MNPEDYDTDQDSLCDADWYYDNDYDENFELDTADREAHNHEHA